MHYGKMYVLPSFLLQSILFTMVTQKTANDVITSPLFISSFEINGNAMYFGLQIREQYRTLQSDIYSYKYTLKNYSQIDFLYTSSNNPFAYPALL